MILAGMQGRSLKGRGLGVGLCPAASAHPRLAIATRSLPAPSGRLLLRRQPAPSPACCHSRGRLLITGALKDEVVADKKPGAEGVPKTEPSYRVLRLWQTAQVW